MFAKRQSLTDAIQFYEECIWALYSLVRLKQVTQNLQQAKLIFQESAALDSPIMKEGYYSILL